MLSPASIFKVMQAIYKALLRTLVSTCAVSNERVARDACCAFLNGVTRVQLTRILPCSQWPSSMSSSPVEVPVTRTWGHPPLPLAYLSMTSHHLSLRRSAMTRHTHVHLCDVTLPCVMVSAFVSLPNANFPETNLIMEWSHSNLVYNFHL